MGDETQDCPVCGGEGYTSNPYEEEHFCTIWCDNCNGTGKVVIDNDN